MRRQTLEEIPLISHERLSCTERLWIALGLLFITLGGMGFGFLGEKGRDEYQRHRLDSTPYVAAAAVPLIIMLGGVVSIHSQFRKALPTITDTSFYHNYMRGFGLFLTCLSATTVGVLGEKVWDEYQRHHMNGAKFCLIATTGFFLSMTILLFLLGRELLGTHKNVVVEVSSRPQYLTLRRDTG